MQVLIENVSRPRKLKVFLENLREHGLAISNVQITETDRWVTIAGSVYGAHFDELKIVTDISFDLPQLNDDAMQILTTAFEGSGLTFSVPSMPGFRWTIA